MVYSNICDEIKKVPFDRADSGGSRTYPPLWFRRKDLVIGRRMQNMNALFLKTQVIANVKVIKM